MATFTELDSMLRGAADTLETQRNKAKQGKSAVTSAATSIAGLPAVYAGLATAVNAFLAANPDDPAAVDLKARKDFLVADFTAANTAAAAMSSALANLDP